MKTTAADRACALSMLAAARRCVARAVKCRKLGQAMPAGSPQRAGLARTHAHILGRARWLIQLAREMAGTREKPQKSCWPLRAGKATFVLKLNGEKLGVASDVNVSLWAQQFGRAKRRPLTGKETLMQALYSGRDLYSGRELPGLWIDEMNHIHSVEAFQSIASESLDFNKSIRGRSDVHG